MKKYLVVITLACLTLLLTWCAYGVSSPDDLDSGYDGAVDAAEDFGPRPPLPDASVTPRDGATISNGGFDLMSSWPIPIYYNYGPVMTKPIRVYLIWYGTDWNNNPAVPVLEDLVNNVGGSNWFDINSAYYQQPSPPQPEGGIQYEAGPPGQLFVANTFHFPFLLNDAGTVDAGVDNDLPKTYVTTQVSLAKEVFIGYTHGYVLSSGDISSIVTEAIGTNTFPSDSNGLYFVLTDKYVNQVASWYGFCTAYCGWHDHTDISGTDIKYSFVGDPARCPQSCTAESDYLGVGISLSPNGSWSADGMSSVMLHELSETATDPDINAWVDGIGYENADKCAWTFGLVYPTNTSVANVKIGDRDWLVQQNWTLDDAGGHCSLGQ